MSIHYIGTIVNQLQSMPKIPALEYCGLYKKHI